MENSVNIGNGVPDARVFENCFLFNIEGGCVAYHSTTGEISAYKGKNADEIARNLQNGEEGNLHSGFDTDSNVSIPKMELPCPVHFEQLYLIITEKCNLSCKYCRQHTSMENATMTESEIDEAVDLFLQTSCNPKSMVLYGGEVMLYPELVLRAIDRLHKNRSEIPVTIITNGMLCTEHIAYELAKRGVFLVFSIDGPEAFHNQARVTHGNTGSYAQAIQGYWNCKNAGCRVGISCTIGPHTAKEMNAIEKWLQELAPISVGFGLPHGDFDNYAYRVDNFADLYRSVFRVAETLRRNGISVVHVERKMRDYYLNSINAYECHACQKRLVICPGRKYGVCEGAVTDERFFFNDVETAKKLSKQWQCVSPLIKVACESCLAKRVCGGGCPYDKLLRYGDVGALDESKCLYQRMLAEYAIKTLGQQLLNDMPEGVLLKYATREDRDYYASFLALQQHEAIPLQFNSEVAVEKRKEIE